MSASCLAISAPTPVGYVRFRQSNEFYYLCGIESPHAYLLLDGNRRRAAVYLPHRNERREAAEGKLLSAEDGDLVKELSGIDEVYGVELLSDHLARYAWGAVNPGDQDHMPTARRLLHVVADRIRWPLKERRVYEQWQRDTGWGKLFTEYQQKGCLLA